MSPTIDATTLWTRTLDCLEAHLTKSTFDAWLSQTRAIEIDGSRLVVGVPNESARDWLEQRLDSAVRRAMAQISDDVSECTFIIRDTLKPPVRLDQSAGNGNSIDSVGTPPVRFEQPRLPTNDRLPSVPPQPSLNARYTFSTFVVGSGNRLAHAAAQAVAEHPAERYNPLFIYGVVGLGKTHLLHAIGHAALARGMRVLAVSSETFTNDLINAIRNHSMDEFRAVYRATDLLLVDDIHFIAGKERTQEEFFHTFNAVYGADGQIVLTSDRPPHSISTLNDRLSSRFQWGLQVDVEPPDLETRIAILRAKTERQGLPVSDAVLAMIAQAVQQNVRELEGALNRVVAYAQCERLPLSPETAERALTDLMLRREPPTLQEILETVARFYNVSRDDIEGRARTASLTEPRHVAMYLMREETEASYPAIGLAVGGRDHTTVLHGWQKVSRLVEREPKLRRDIMQIRAKLYAS